MRWREQWRLIIAYRSYSAAKTALNSVESDFKRLGVESPHPSPQQATTETYKEKMWELHFSENGR